MKHEREFSAAVDRFMDGVSFEAARVAVVRAPATGIPLSIRRAQDRPVGSGQYEYAYGEERLQWHNLADEIRAGNESILADLDDVLVAISAFTDFRTAKADFGPLSYPLDAMLTKRQTVEIIPGPDNAVSRVSPTPRPEE